MNLITFASDTVIIDKMNKSVFTLMLFFLLAAAAQAQTQTEKLLRGLDEVLDKRDQYTNEKLQHIKLLNM